MLCHSQCKHLFNASDGVVVDALVCEVRVPQFDTDRWAPSKRNGQPTGYIGLIKGDGRIRVSHQETIPPPRICVEITFLNEFGSYLNFSFSDQKVKTNSCISLFQNMGKYKHRYNDTYTFCDEVSCSLQFIKSIMRKRAPFRSCIVVRKYVQIYVALFVSTNYYLSSGSRLVNTLYFGERKK